MEHTKKILILNGVFCFECHQEKDHRNKTEELQSEISQRERHIKNLDDEGHRLRRQVEYLSREIENKGKEVSKVKAEADMSLK